ncbi:polyketide cyclase [Nakamurella sp. YIM 132087]|uniref:Polyketide cyclase n=1 Tax=Nakamurella alba TaxID=2665158 RepID=A0A7K1FP84_9ACTN|nr:SRPBCC family protein [Nakamurella alba]MTD14624.1 polyketide cyclase [Nakamurella alba]
MTETSRTFTVTPPPATVLSYLEDFGHAEEWDPGTETCTREDAGPVGVGSQWHNVSKIAGREVELTYTLKERSASRLVFVGENDSATSTDTIDVVPAGTGSEITYTADVEMHGAAKLATPIIKLIFEKLGNETEDQMSDTLNRLQH